MRITRKLKYTVFAISYIFIFLMKQLSNTILIGYVVNVQVCEAENVELTDKAGLKKLR